MAAAGSGCPKRSSRFGDAALAPSQSCDGGGQSLEMAERVVAEGELC